ncbi:intein C-terminal splicing domain protein, partial [Leptospira broomii serovar Hurstbridge str. 5399]
TYTNGNVINTTWNHPFFIRGKGFTEVRNIQPEERSVTVASIRNSYRIERGSGIQIGASLASLGSRSTNSNSATWKDEIRGTVGIAKIEEVYEKTKVYNFEVEENHTYFVGKDGVLVHNSGGCMAGGFATGVGKSIARLVDAPQHLIETGASIAAPDNFRVTDEFGRPVSAHPLEAPLSKGAASTLYDKLVTEPGAEKAANSTCPDCSKDYSTGYKWGNFIGDGMLLVAGGLTALRGKLGGLGGKAGAAEERAVVRKAGAANSEKFKGLGDATTSPWLKDTRPGVAEHIGKFRDGGSFVMTESQYKAFYEANKSGKYGRPNGQFMTTRETIDQVTRGGQVDISTLNKKLGTDFKPGDKLVRVDINNPLLHNARLPAGVGPGANSQFRWGGYTSGGAPEIVIDQFKKGQFSSSKLY